MTQILGFSDQGLKGAIKNMLQREHMKRLEQTKMENLRKETEHCERGRGLSGRGWPSLRCLCARASRRRHAQLSPKSAPSPSWSALRETVGKTLCSQRSYQGDWRDRSLDIQGLVLAPEHGLHAQNFSFAPLLGYLLYPHRQLIFSLSTVFVDLLTI